MEESPWETPITSSREDFSISFRFQDIRGRLECVGVEVSRSNHPITTSFMRSHRWSELIEAKKRINLRRARRWASRKGLPTSRLPVEAELTREAVKMISAWEASVGGRPRQYGPDHWAQVVTIYSDAYGAGLPPTKAVADTFQVSRSTAAKWVARARRDGLLPKTKPRVARGRKRTTGRGKG
jgi:hypothetical protein